ncbi:hypothetical protein [Parapedobacter sp. 2B3]|uniref:hypothetical protein n=1 Tax=Parapedobacter sp. 2B3 TaxID=3342381 RepID=UPI0035B5A1FA
MNNYIQTRKMIHDEVEQLPIIDSVQWHYKFSAFSASLRWLMPYIPQEQHEALFRQTLLNQRLANLDEYYFNELSIQLQADNAVDLAGLTSRPSIVCTYHLGSYRLLPHWLMARGVSICTLLATDVLEAQGEGMLALAANTCLRNGATCTLIDAQRPKAGLQMRTALRQGKTIVAYLDGNTGTLPNNRSTNAITIPFLHGEMRVRTGLATLANIARVPLYSMVSEPVVGREATIRCLQVIAPPKGKERPIFAYTATDELYGDLQSVVKRHPWWWDGWLSVHEQLY